MSAATNQAPAAPTADANTPEDAIKATLEEAAESLAAALHKGRGMQDIKVESEQGYRLWGLRFGHAVSVTASRVGDTPIGANDLNLIASTLRIPSAAMWQFDRWIGRNNMLVQAAVCLYEIAN